MTLAPICCHMQALALLPTQPTPQTKRGKPKRAKAMTQALQIQDMLVKDCMDENTTATARSLCARAFESLERLKRDMRMQPKPKPVDVAFVRKSRAGSTTRFEEPQERTPSKVKPPPQSITQEAPLKDVANESASAQDATPDNPTTKPE